MAEDLDCHFGGNGARRHHFRLAAQEGSSESLAHLLAPYQTRWALRRLLLFSVNAL